MKLSRLFVLLGVAMAVGGAVPALMKALADTKPNVQLNTDNVAPHELEDITQRAILRDYTAAWQALNTALSNNTTAPLNNNFAGFALDKLTQRVKDQKSRGLRTKIIDRGHQVDAIFYSRDGSAVELRDIASLEIQILDGNELLHSEQVKIQYIAVMTGAADRWQVRVLESAP